MWVNTNFTLEVLVTLQVGKLHAPREDYLKSMLNSVNEGLDQMRWKRLELGEASGQPLAATLLARPGLGVEKQALLCMAQADV